MTMNLKLSLKGTALVVLVLIGHVVATAPVNAQVWVPISGGGRVQSQLVTQSSVFPVPPSILGRGGVIRAVLVGGGEGGFSAQGNCNDGVVQGGRGGDGGEVVEVDIPLVAGQCPAGLVSQIGANGRGALRAGNASSSGEPGGMTTVSCAGAVLAYALGGGKRPDAVTASRSAKGGAGAAAMNSLESTAADANGLRSIQIMAAREGQAGLHGYGSGGGGGGVSVMEFGVSTSMTNSQIRGMVRNAPLGKGGHGAGSGAGPNGYAPGLPLNPAENGLQYGAGGGGGFAYCGISSSINNDAGNGAPGVIKYSWQE